MMPRGSEMATPRHRDDHTEAQRHRDQSLFLYIDVLAFSVSHCLDDLVSSVSKRLDVLVSSVSR
jgi:hypothetical protein